MSDTFLRVTATIHASPAVVFDLLASPHRHREIDASGTVGTDEADEPITKLGQVFRMNMSHGSGETLTEYQTDNHVIAFEPNRVLAWAVAPVDGEPLGWTWRYELSPKKKSDDKTKVALIYDWSEASEENRKRYGVPGCDEEGLETSLAMLQKVLTRG